MREQPGVLKNVAHPTLLRRQKNAVFRIAERPAVEDDAPLLRLRQAADGVNQRGLARPGDTENSGDPRCGQRFVKRQAVAAQRLGKVKLKHGYLPIRARLRRDSHSETSSEASASAMEIRHSRAAALSPPGI